MLVWNAGSSTQVVPWNSQNCYAGCTSFPEADSGKGDKSKLPKTIMVSTGSTLLGKREKLTAEKPPPAKNRNSVFKVEDFVNLHDSKLATFLAVLCKYLVIDAYCVVAREYLQLAMQRGN